MNQVTEEYDENFINFCVMYDGQEEIVDAVRNIVQENIASNQIDKDTGKISFIHKRFSRM